MRGSEYSTFESCNEHESGHFAWCMKCEIERLREIVMDQADTIRALSVKSRFPAVGYEKDAIEEISAALTKYDY